MEKPGRAVAASMALLVGAAVLWAVLSHGAPVAFADVLQQMDRVRAVTYQKVVQEEGQEPTSMQHTVKEGGLFRTELPNGRITIDHYADGQRLTLVPAQKQARLTHGIQPDLKTLVHWVDYLRALHETDSRFLRQEPLDGRITNVYQADRPYEPITIWTDPATNLPVRIERVILPCTDKNIRVPEMIISLNDFQDKPKGTPGAQDAARPSKSFSNTIWGPGILEKKITVVMTGFVWNTDLDDSLFSLTPPEGYKVQTMEYGSSSSEEDALVAALRFWADTSDGRFPQDINLLADARPNLVKKFHKGDAAEKEYEQAIQMMDTVLKGMYFAQTLKLKDNWYYAGDHVGYGQAGQPLCWWKTGTDKIYRVIFGDLSVRDVFAEQLPALVSHQGT